MAKRVQIVLNQTVNKLGRSGDLVEVAPGYARNYLIPQGMGIVATPGIVRQVEQRRAKELARLAAEKAAAEARKVAFQTIGRLSIAKPLGEDEAIFGTVTTQDIVDVIKAGTGQEVDRRGITIPEIGKLGVYKAQVKLHPEVVAEVEFQVVAQ
jgi:large subunit ribosomal protein L9